MPSFEKCRPLRKVVWAIIFIQRKRKAREKMLKRDFEAAFAEVLPSFDQEDPNQAKYLGTFHALWTLGRDHGENVHNRVAKQQARAEEIEVKPLPEGTPDVCPALPADLGGHEVLIYLTPRFRYGRQEPKRKSYGWTWVRVDPILGFRPHHRMGMWREPYQGTPRGFVGRAEPFSTGQIRNFRPASAEVASRSFGRDEMWGAHPDEYNGVRIVAPA